MYTCDKKKKKTKTYEVDEYRMFYYIALMAWEGHAAAQLENNIVQFSRLKVSRNV